MTDNERIGMRIRNRREQLQLTQEELGTSLAVNKSTIQRYESGKVAKIKLPILQAIADALKVNPNWLALKTDKMAQEEISNAIPVTGMLPIYGCIPAGLPALADECIEGYMPTSVPNPDEYFYLRVKGDSMIGAGIVDGCKVLIHKQNTADDGQIVACRVNGDEATLKRFKHHGSVVLLKPENSAYDDRIVPVEDFENGSAQIIGVVKQIVIDM
ncbi:MAG: helix-turn-helix domain-containing protein [Clostridia bacterium]|nr:helix-turn-helix domain-containing protein [Clostridia bacterium]